jgi:hypothetical protein
MLNNSAAHTELTLQRPFNLFPPAPNLPPLAIKRKEKKKENALWLLKEE